MSRRCCLARCAASPALGAEADAGQEGRPAGNASRHHHGVARFQFRLHRVERLAIDHRRHLHDRDFAFRLLLAGFVRARVEPMLTDIGRAGQDRVDLSEATASTVAGEDAAFVEIAGDRLGPRLAWRGAWRTKKMLRQYRRMNFA